MATKEPTIVDMSGLRRGEFRRNNADKAWRLKYPDDHWFQQTLVGRCLMKDVVFVHKPSPVSEKGYEGFGAIQGQTLGAGDVSFPEGFEDQEVVVFDENSHCYIFHDNKEIMATEAPFAILEEDGSITIALH